MYSPLRLSSLAALGLLSARVITPDAAAQSLECTVQVNYEAVAATHKDKLVDFEADVRTYLNGYDWGSEELEEPIVCTINIFVNGVRGDNEYTAQVFVGSQRPVFGSNRNSPVLRLFDPAWEFSYIRNRPLSRTFYQFDHLTSFLDFYAFLIIGYDFDTFGPGDGSPYFQKASDLASLGRSSGRQGWESKPGSFTRAQLIEEILTPRNAPARRAMFDYHFGGLDSLALNPAVAYAKILRALEVISTAGTQAGARELFVRAFFDAKHMEIAEVFSSHPDPAVFDRIIRIDENHRSTYEETRRKLR